MSAYYRFYTVFTVKITRFTALLLLAVSLSVSSAFGQNSVPFTILHTNDEHSHLIPHPVSLDSEEAGHRALGGFARLAGAALSIRESKQQQGEPVLMLSAGDFTGGPAFSWLATQGEAPELTLFQAIGYDAVVLGNHEFDYGTDMLAQYLARAGYPEAHECTAVLGSNFIIPEEHPLSQADIQKTVIRTLSNGLRVGLFGLLGEDAISKTAFPEPVTFQHYLESARESVSELQAQGADVIVAVTHSGQIEDRKLAEEVDGIHVIVGGHFHASLFEPLVVNETVIVQAGSYTRYLGQLELAWLPDEQRVMVRNRENGTPFLLELNHRVEPNEEISLMVNRYEQQLDSLVAAMTNRQVQSVRDVIVYADFPLERKHKQESAIGNFITDGMRIQTESVLGEPVHMAAQANGAIRGSVQPGPDGGITFYDLINTTGLGSGEDGLPGYPIVSFFLSGKELKRTLEVSVLLSEMLADNYYLQFSGLSMTYDPGRALWGTIPIIDQPVPSTRAVLSSAFHPGSEIQSSEGVTEPIEDDRLYRVVTDYYIAGFLPMVGELLPSLTIEFKHADGSPAELDDTIVYENGRELKVWQTVIRHAHMFSDVSGPGYVPDKYSDSNQRLIVADGPWLWRWPVAGAVGVMLITGYWIYRRKRRVGR
ncbi:MAG: bifunctional metallophosphatase/5'-nucleotidase [Balneolaceae bacterium]